MALQFLDTWKGGLRSNRIVWEHKEIPIRFRTYPMLHIGSIQFYEIINAEIASDDFILVEGIGPKGRTRQKPFYDKAARALDLVTQRESMRRPDDVPVINIDMPHSEFRRRLARLPIVYWLAIKLIRYILWFLVKIAISYPDGRQEFLGWYGERRRKRSDTALDRLLITARDRVIVENLRSFVEEHRNSDTR